MRRADRNNPHLNVARGGMPYSPDVEYSFEYRLNGWLLEERYERRHPRNVDMYLTIRVLKRLVPLSVVVLLHQVPIVESFSLKDLLSTF